MQRDDITEEIRTYREAYAKRFGYDLRAMCRDLKEKERQSGREVVSPERLPSKKVAGTP